MDVTKLLVDIDGADLALARDALRTIQDTVNAALREATAVAARGREVERLTSGSIAALADEHPHRERWR